MWNWIIALCLEGLAVFASQVGIDSGENQGRSRLEKCGQVVHSLQQMEFPLHAENVSIGLNCLDPNNLALSSFRKQLSLIPRARDQSADVLLNTGASHASPLWSWRKWHCSKFGFRRECDFSHDEQIGSRRLSNIFQCYMYEDLKAASRFSVRPLILCTKNTCTVNREISSQLTFGRLLKAPIGIESRTQGSGDEVHAETRDDGSDRRQREHPKRNPGHIPLGLKIALLAPFIPLGFWIGYRFLDWGVRGPRAIATVLGMIFGASIATAAFMAMIN